MLKITHVAKVARAVIGYQEGSRMIFQNSKLPFAVLFAFVILTLAGCSWPKRHTELECMERAMYFESNRSSRDGMVAVGSVVMHRVGSVQFPNTVCGVVGQKGQFAPGIMSNRMNSTASTQVKEAANQGNRT